MSDEIEEDQAGTFSKSRAVNARAATLSTIPDRYRSAADDAAAEMGIRPNNGMGWAMIRAIIARDEIERMLIQIDGLVHDMPETIRNSAGGATEAVRVALVENAEGFAQPVVDAAADLTKAIKASRDNVATDIKKIYESTRPTEILAYKASLAEATRAYVNDLHAAQVKRSNLASLAIALAMIFGAVFIYVFGFWTAIAVHSNPLTQMIVRDTDPIFGWLLSR